MKELTSLDHPTVKHLVKLRENRSYRHAERLVLIEGIKMVNEVCKDKGCEMVLASNLTLFPSSIPINKRIFITDAMMKKICGTATPEGIIAVVPMPEPKKVETFDSVLVLDKISDPGNMGTLIRTALALNWDGVFITEGSCDPYNDKALRAAKGATFRLPLSFGAWDHLEVLIKNQRWTPYLAAMDGEPLADFPLNGPILLALGNETHGSSPEARQLCHRITIPMNNSMESLNVSIAGGIMMYELNKERI